MKKLIRTEGEVELRCRTNEGSASPTDAGTRKAFQSCRTWDQTAELLYRHSELSLNMHSPRKGIG